MVLVTLFYCQYSLKQTEEGGGGGAVIETK